MAFCPVVVRVGQRALARASCGGEVWARRRRAGFGSLRVSFLGRYVGTDFPFTVLDVSHDSKNATPNGYIRGIFLRGELVKLLVE